MHLQSWPWKHPNITPDVVSLARQVQALQQFSAHNPLPSRKVRSYSWEQLQTHEGRHSYCRHYKATNITTGIRVTDFIPLYRSDDFATITNHDLRLDGLD